MYSNLTKSIVSTSITTALFELTAMIESSESMGSINPVHGDDNNTTVNTICVYGVYQHYSKPTSFIIRNLSIR